MSRIDAKRMACKIASSVLSSASDAWETLDPWPEEDRDKIEAAWEELVSELFRRGFNAPPRPEAL